MQNQFGYSIVLLNAPHFSTLHARYDCTRWKSWRIVTSLLALIWRLCDRAGLSGERIEFGKDVVKALAIGSHGSVLFTLLFLKAIVALRMTRKNSVDNGVLEILHQWFWVLSTRNDKVWGNGWTLSNGFGRGRSKPFPLAAANVADYFLWSSLWVWKHRTWRFSWHNEEEVRRASIMTVKFIEELFLLVPCCQLPSRPRSFQNHRGSHLCASLCKLKTVLLFSGY